MAKEKNHPSVDWRAYFSTIRSQCPWSYKADQLGLIDIVEWQGQIWPLAPFQARVYVVQATEAQVQALAQSMDHGEDEWLWSYPGYGEWATPVAVLIQQNRSQLAKLRHQLQV